MFEKVGGLRIQLCVVPLQALSHYVTYTGTLDLKVMDADVSE